MLNRECPHCHNTAFRRVNRVGRLQQIVLPYFGFFPWECVFCRRRYFFRDDGHSLEARAAERARRRQNAS